MILELGLKIVKKHEDDKYRNVVSFSPFLYFEVLIMLLMCDAYLTFDNPKTMQIRSVTFCLLNLGIPENNTGTKCYAASVMWPSYLYLIDNIELVYMSGCCEKNENQMYGSSRRDSSY